MEIIVTRYDDRHRDTYVVQAPDGSPTSQLAARLGLEGEGLAIPSGKVPLLHGLNLAEPATARPSPGVRVAIAAGPDAGGSVVLEPGRTVSVGRSRACELQIEDPSISRCHLRLRLAREAIVVDDLASTNGLVMNQQPTASTQLAAESNLRVGSSRLELLTEPVPPLASTVRCGRQVVTPWSRPVPDVAAVTFTRPSLPGRRAVRSPSALAWVLPLVIATAVALVLRMPWIMLFGLLGPAMVLGQYLGDRKAALKEHRAALREHHHRSAEMDEAIRVALLTESAHRRRLHPGVVGVLRSLLPEPTVELWTVGSGPVEVVVGEHTALSNVTVDGQPLPLAEAPLPMSLDQPIAIIGRPHLRDAAVRSWLLQACTRHPPSRFGVAIDSREPPSAWDVLAWLPHTHPATAPEDPTCEYSLRWGQDLVLVDDPRDAPQEGTRILLLDARNGLLQHPGQPDVPFVPTLMSLEVARSLARRLASLSDGSTTAAAEAPTLGRLTTWPQDPDLVTWHEGAADLRVPVGTDSGGCTAYLDLQRDGPHALVAGTTGSGKSELLRTLITSLALRNSPRQLCLLLIDYKGGASLAECDRLPHSSGLVTDLDAHLGERVLISLRAELKRRERVLADAGVRDLREYTGPDLPRLVIVVDEFRVIAEEIPDFLDGMVRLAAVGRSLGLHLVLATQRPAGVVSADLRANVNLRIALRVRDQADSLDVIECTDAAQLPEDRPGLALMRTGSSPIRRIQVAPAAPQPSDPAPHARPDARSRWTIRRAPDLWSAWATINAPELIARGESGLADLPEILGAAAEARHESARPVWVPALPNTVTPRELATHPQQSASASTHDAWALADRPERQRTELLRWQAASHIAIVGAAATGRTTAAQALARSALTAEGSCWLYLLDPGGGLDGWATCSRVRARVGPDQRAHGLRVLEVINAEIDRRRAQSHRERTPVVVLLDGWDRWIEDYEGLEGGRGIDLALRMLREGAGADVYCIVTGDRSLLVGKPAAHLPDVWALHLHDQTDLLLAGLRPNQIPVDPPPGRLVRPRDGVVAQVVLDDQTGHRDEHWHTRSPHEQGAPQAVAALPLEVSGSGWAVGGDDAEQLPPPPGSLIVLGPPRSGVSTALHQIAAATTEGSSSHARGSAPALQGSSPSLLTMTPERLLAAELPDLLQHHTGTVIVDDVHLLAGTPADELILSWARTTGGRVLAGGDLDACANQFQGLVPWLTRQRTGVVLQPSSPQDGLCLGARLPVGDSKVPGRGVLVERGRCTRIQVVRDDPPADP
ncbi:FtsK/SpoIIIE domain-containing protein [Ornithinimicrobium sp. Y1847]|uniref:FtsK/SpoIIIE domain-containing protein n=1 Tax=Ornithinimicrobium sp. Y1847 TaxID=3405419 RepID=UPI003B67FD32